MQTVTEWVLKPGFPKSPRLLTRSQAVEELGFTPEHAEGGQWGAAGQALRSSSPVSPWACKTANTHGQDPALTLLTRQQQNVLTRNIFLKTEITQK